MKKHESIKWGYFIFYLSSFLIAIISYNNPQNHKKNITRLVYGTIYCLIKIESKKIDNRCVFNPNF